MHNRTATRIFLIVLFPLFIISISALSIAFDPLLYDKEFSRLGVYGTFGKSLATEANEKVVEYLSGKSPSVDTSFFTEREKTHLADVKAIFSLLVLIALLFAVVFLLTILSVKGKAGMAARVLWVGSLLLAGTIGFMWLAFAMDFDGSFSALHVTLFRQGTYLFDPAAENIVNLYPEELFESFAQKVALQSALLALVGLFGGWCMGKQQSKHGQAGNKQKDI